ncbi:MAG: hypothetical protein ACQKBW_12480 [Puniceicoccales bacterium]
MGAIEIILGGLIGAAVCALVCLLTAFFAQIAMRLVVKRMPSYGKAYVVVFKITLISFYLNLFLQQLYVLNERLIYLSMPLAFLLWIGLNSLLYGKWFTRRQKPIGFVKGLLVNLVVSGFTFILGLVVTLPIILMTLSNASAE